MTPDQFIWWLRGYLDSLGDETAEMPRADARAIRASLDRVGPHTPVPASPPPTQSAFDKLGAKCPRCGSPHGLGQAHFCNGALVHG